MGENEQEFDLLIIGGGVNGAGIARDAAGRGLNVVLCEMDDLASATSSASTKLFHGGLRYLEQYAFRLVRKALREREVLLGNMPHIARPMRFVLPFTPGARPAWLLRLGLFIYDHLGGRRLLPPTRTLDLTVDPAGRVLRPGFRKAFEFSDVAVDDARLVVLNARDAADRGASILTRTRVIAARRDGERWQVEVENRRTRKRRFLGARAVVNAAGPWVNQVLEAAVGQPANDPIRLVRGSHIVTARLFDHNRAYFFQNADGRIIFAIPYQQDFTLIGTTDRDHAGDPASATCTASEAEYLCSAASEYFREPIRADDIVWSFAGVRPLDDAGDKNPSEASRDYHLEIADADGALPLISVYGGKITTYRKLAEQVVGALGRYLPLNAADWTSNAPLPGGDFMIDQREAQIVRLHADYPFLTRRNAERLFSGYGTQSWRVLGDIDDVAEDFGGGLLEAELRWLCDHEWAETVDDVIWRRTKCGLRMSADEITRLAGWLADRDP